MSPEFVPALELNAGFYREIVAPLVGDRPHAAALLGYGSELLGFDTERSTDHGWGPRLQVFVAPDDVAPVRAAIDGGLPAEYRGWPVAFGWDAVPVAHHVHVGPLGDWLRSRLGCNPLDEMAFVDWLTMPQQRLLGVVRGAVYHDHDGALTAVRERLAYFPPDLALWMTACQWRRVWQVEPFVGRTGGGGRRGGLSSRRRPHRARPHAPALPARPHVLAVRQVVRLRVPRTPARPAPCSPRSPRSSTRPTIRAGRTRSSPPTRPSRACTTTPV